jgi:hypothetical protein
MIAADAKVLLILPTARIGRGLPAFAVVLLRRSRHAVFTAIMLDALRDDFGMRTANV